MELPSCARIAKFLNPIFTPQEGFYLSKYPKIALVGSKGSCKPTPESDARKSSQKGKKLSLVSLPPRLRSSQVILEIFVERKDIQFIGVGNIFRVGLEEAMQ